MEPKIDHNLTQSLAALTDKLPYARDTGIRFILIRTTAGISRALYEPVLQRLTELGAQALVLSGDPNEGDILANVRPAPCHRAAPTTSPANVALRWSSWAGNLTCSPPERQPAAMRLDRASAPTACEASPYGPEGGSRVKSPRMCRRRLSSADVQSATLTDFMAKIEGVREARRKSLTCPRGG